MSAYFGIDEFSNNAVNRTLYWLTERQIKIDLQSLLVIEGEIMNQIFGNICLFLGGIKHIVK